MPSDERMLLWFKLTFFTQYCIRTKQETLLYIRMVLAWFTCKKHNIAVAQKTGIPKWVALLSGNMDQHLRNPSDRLILSHTHMFGVSTVSALALAPCQPRLVWTLGPWEPGIRLALAVHHGIHALDVGLQLSRSLPDPTRAKRPGEKPRTKLWSPHFENRVDWPQERNSQPFCLQLKLFKPEKSLKSEFRNSGTEPCICPKPV